MSQLGHPRLLEPERFQSNPGLSAFIRLRLGESLTKLSNRQTRNREPSRMQSGARGVSSIHSVILYVEVLLRIPRYLQHTLGRSVRLFSTYIRGV